MAGSKEDLTGQTTSVLGFEVCAAFGQTGGGKGISGGGNSLGERQRPPPKANVDSAEKLRGIFLISQHSTERTRVQNMSPQAGSPASNGRWLMSATDGRREDVLPQGGLEKASYRDHCW